MSETKYLLRFGKSCQWFLIATPETRSWVKKFATIMNLEKKEEDQIGKWPRMFFFLKTSKSNGAPSSLNRTDLKTKEDFPKTGWKAQEVKPLRLWSHPTSPDIICEIEDHDDPMIDIIKMWTSLHFIYLQAQNGGALPLHTALIEREGKGVLLGGPAGIGKSTTCRRLLSPWRALSDDQSLIMENKERGYLAHPLPTWSEHLWKRSTKKWNTEKGIPLSAIFFLERAEVNKVVPIKQEKAAALIYRSSIEVYRTVNAKWKLGLEEKRKLKIKIFDNACKLAKAIPAYTLHFSLTGRFWEEIEKVLQDAYPR